MSEAITRESIEQAAYAYRRTISPEFIDIHTGNEEYFSRMSEGEKSKFIDNMLLDWYGFSLGDGSACYTRADLKKLYEAAKVMFARHPDEGFTFDLDSAAGGWGSPWEHRCLYPEEWVMVYARRAAETDEACITGWSKEKARAVVEVIQDLEAIGVPANFLSDESFLMDACYCNRRLYWVMVPMLCDLPKAA